MNGDNAPGQPEAQGAEEDPTLEWASVQRSGEFQSLDEALGAGEFAEPCRLVTGYRRATEFDDKDAEGQDYCHLRASDRFVVAVVVDGVSGSFRPASAASIVGWSLVDVLWNRRREPPPSDVLQRRLDGVMRQLVAQTEHPPSALATRVNPRFQAVVKSRQDGGSEVVFVAAVVDLARRRATFYQLGDASAKVRVDGVTYDLTAQTRAERDGRWSSRFGFNVEVKRCVEAPVDAVILASDGLSPCPDPESEDFFTSSELGPKVCADFATRDDVAFVRVGWPPRPPPSRSFLDVKDTEVHDLNESTLVSADAEGPTPTDLPSEPSVPPADVTAQVPAVLEEPVSEVPAADSVLRASTPARPIPPAARGATGSPRLGLPRPSLPPPGPPPRVVAPVAPPRWRWYAVALGGVGVLAAVALVVAVVVFFTRGRG